jgi:outer membrane protein OmpA-like peptidoglycan-associated protein
MRAPSSSRAGLFLGLATLVGCASQGPSPLLTLRRVVLNQSGSGYFERTGRVSGDRLALRLRSHEVDDVLATLTVLERGEHPRQTVVAAGVPHVTDSNARDAAVSLDLRLPDARPRDLMVAYAVPTANWQATYRVVLPDHEGSPALVQIWALLHNSSDEDWNAVEMTLATGAPLSFAFHLRTPSFTARPDASGRLVSPVANAPVVAETTRGLENRNGDVDEESGGRPTNRRGERADRDGDGIMDVSDRCPDQTETYNGRSDDDGCPDQGMVQMESAQLRILHSVYFAANAVDLPPRSVAVIESVAAVLRASPEIQLLEVQGNAADDEASGWSLALNRAATVRARLLAMGIAADRLRTRSFGTTRPLVQGATAADRARNRYVSFQIAEAPRDATAANTTPSTGVTVANLSASAATDASAREFAGATRFTVAEPVSIAAGSAALVTIASREIPGDDVYLFRPESAAAASREHPYRAARLRNTTGMTLLPGPVALFAGGTFAGEGLLDRLHEGETTFIPYAIDPSTTVRTEVTDRREPRRIVSVLRAEVVLEDTAVHATRYTIAPGAQAPSRIFLRHAHLPGYEPRALPPESESTAEADLVPIPLTARRESVVTLEQTTAARHPLSLLDDVSTDLAPYLAASSEGMRQRLTAIVDQRNALARAEREAEEIREQLGDVAERNAELRETLRTLGAVTDAARVALRTRLTQQLSASMARHATLSTELATRGANASTLRTQLVDALRGLRYDADAAAP